MAYTSFIVGRIRAPTFSYSSSENPLVYTCGVLYIHRVTSLYQLVWLLTGVNDTRFSLFLISLGIPTIIIVTFKGFDCLKDNKMSEK